MLRGSMVEHHIKHEAYATSLCLGNKTLNICHGAETRVNAAIIRHIITIVPLGRYEERRNPKVIHPKLGQIIQFLNDARQIPQTIAVGIPKGFWIYLINNFIMETSHEKHSFSIFAKLPQNASVLQKLFLFNMQL